MTEVGLSEEEIAHVLRACPRQIAADFAHRFEFLKTAIEGMLGYPVGSAAAAIRRSPALLGCARTTVTHVEALLQYGMSSEQVKKIFNKVPGILALSAERTIIPKLELIRQYGYTLDEIVDGGGECLVYPLEGKIRPRLERARGSGILLPAPAPRPALRHLLRSQESSFSGWIQELQATDTQQVKERLVEWLQELPEFARHVAAVQAARRGRRGRLPRPPPQPPAPQPQPAAPPPDPAPDCSPGPGPA
eukprot:tig00021168_g19108.t1